MRHYSRWFSWRMKSRLSGARVPEHGFTLVEALVAATLVAIFFAAIFELNAIRRARRVHYAGAEVILRRNEIEKRRQRRQRSGSPITDRGYVIQPRSFRRPARPAAKRRSGSEIVG